MCDTVTDTSKVKPEGGAPLPREGWVSGRCYLTGVVTVSVIKLLVQIFSDSANVDLHLWITLGLSWLAYVTILIFIFGQTYLFEVSIRAGFLGMTTGFGVLLVQSHTPGYAVFGWYVIFLSVFHFSEYLITAYINPLGVNLDSFLLNHSVAYGVAAVASWLEYFIELHFLPGLKSYFLVSVIGILLCCGGEAMRKIAMLTAGSNFNHIVQTQKTEGHVLVTHGVYGICRHPSYAGWFWWSIGTQVLLCNPVCLLGYAVASWRFFNERIYVEEMCLLSFFNESYKRYQATVGTGLPFISGYQV